MVDLYTYAYPKADHTVDAVCFGVNLSLYSLQVLLVRRGRPNEPYFGSWALPGGFIEMGEDLDTSLLRELREETGLTPRYIEQLYTFGKPDRDPRGRVISTAYLALVPADAVQAGDDASDCRWFYLNRLPGLAFDHEKILQLGLQRLRSKIRWQPVGIELLPPEFTLGELQKVYEIILGKTLDKRNFRKTIESYGVLEKVPLGLPREGKKGPGPSGQLFRFRKDVYEDLLKKGVDFEV